MLLRRNSAILMLCFSYTSGKIYWKFPFSLRWHFVIKIRIIICKIRQIWWFKNRKLRTLRILLPKFFIVCRVIFWVILFSSWRKVITKIKIIVDKLKTCISGMANKKVTFLVFPCCLLIFHQFPKGWIPSSSQNFITFLYQKQQLL